MNKSMNTDPVVIDDDDDVNTNPVVILDEDDEKTIEIPAIETIDLEDETSTQTKAVTVNNKTTNIVSKKTNFKKTEAFINNLRNNKLMDKIVKRCTSMDSASGMPRVIHKTLLPLYRDTENTFKQSEFLRALLKKTYKLLIRDPNHKFLHIKTLCEELKSGGLRRKVPFVTLATNLKNNGSQWKFKELTSSSRKINQNKDENRLIEKVYKRIKSPKKRVPTVFRKANQSKNCIKDEIKRIIHADKEKADIIDLDDSDNESVKVDSSRNDDQNDVIIIEDSNKENDDNNSSSSSDDNMDELLIPKNHIEVLPIECDVSHNENDEKIALLESQMARYKQIIDKLEEVEVTNEDCLSAYYQCSEYKKRVVDFYRQICEIKGTRKDIVKRRKIRLHVAENHPHGPAKKLEEFLNNMMDYLGAVEFPDFADVVQCVVESNVNDKLGWNRQQIIEEAISLFRQCGQALRKRRQKREYKDLLSFVRDKEQTDDPADKDPILQAKLEENKLIAKIKEEEILERYVNMEKNASMRRCRIAQPANTVTFEGDKDTSGSDSESEPNITLPIIKTYSNMNNKREIGESSKSNINLDLLLTHNTIVTSTNINTNVPSMLRHEHNEQCVIGESSKNNDVINNNLDVKSIVPASTSNSMIKDLLNTPQKPVEARPLDIQSMLDELGDDFVCHIFDIEDPFLVIEISSDGTTDDEL